MNISDRIMVKVGSIQRFLVIVISLLFSLYLLATYQVSKAQTKHEIDELFDPQLAHSAFLLFDLLAQSIASIDQDNQNLPLVYHNFGVPVDLDKAMHNSPAGEQFVYENKFAYQVFNTQQKLLIKSGSAPDLPFANQQQGYSTLLIEGDVWRIYSLYNNEQKFWLYVAENSSIRDELSQEIVAQIVWPSLLVFPLFLLLLVLIIRLGIAPLKQLVVAINQRDGNSLAVIKLEVVPKEVRPVLQAINALMLRLEDTLLREKRLTADTAHELRTPLSVVLIHAQNALNNHSESQRNSALTALDSGVKRVARLLEQLLTLSKINPDTMPQGAVNIHQLTQQVMAEMALKTINKNQELSLECTPDAKQLSLLASDFLLEILIRNLVDNASQYTPEFGEIKLTLTIKNSHCCLTVEDSGIGIDKQLYPRLTERFYRQHQQQGRGAGLGLTLVKNITEFHQGTLSFDSAAMGGLQVKVNLPINSKGINYKGINYKG